MNIPLFSIGLHPMLTYVALSGLFGLSKSERTFGAKKGFCTLTNVEYECKVRNIGAKKIFLNFVLQ
jgi:hypothetical protein